MKLSKTICLFLLVWTVCAVSSRGEQSFTDINPALLYYQAFLLAPEPLSKTDREYLASKAGLEQKLPDRFGKIVAGSDNQMRIVRHAAQSKVPCNWGIDLSEGPNTALPHLARSKAISQTAQLRAAWALQNERQDDARDDLLASFVLGRNAASDGLLFGALVQCMVESITYTTVAQHFGQFSAETLQRLVDGVDKAPARHTMSESIATEKELAAWILNKLLELRAKYPGDDARVMEAFRNSGVVQAMDYIKNVNFWPRLMAASGGTSEGVLKLLRETEPIFPRLTKIMALPQPEYERQSKQFIGEAQQSQNPFMTGFATVLESWNKLGFRSTEFKAQAQEAMVRAAVAYKLHGESGLRSVKDPFGTGPFEFRRFVFKGVDRGFELRSAYAGADAPFVLIFVEKQGPAFQISGSDAGKAIK